MNVNFFYLLYEKNVILFMLVMKMKKIVAILLIIAVIVPIIGFFIYKGVLLSIYKTVDESEIKEMKGVGFSETINNLKINDEKLTVHTKVSNLNEYVYNGNVKFRIIGEYEEVKSNFDSENQKMFSIDKNSESPKVIASYINENILEKFVGENMYKSNPDIAYKFSEFFRQKNINSDIDLYKYIYSKNEQNIKNNIFMSEEQMQENVLISSALLLTPHVKDGITLIDGDYNGYMIKLYNSDFDVRWVYITKNGISYKFHFANFSDEEIIEFLNSIVIE